jgi:hypothetical protein
MNLHPIGVMMVDGEYCRVTALRQMTPEQLLHLGARHVVYLRADGMCDDGSPLVLYGADGSAIARPDDVETAVEMVAEWGLDFASIH